MVAVVVVVIIIEPTVWSFNFAEKTGAGPGVGGDGVSVKGVRIPRDYLAE